MKGAYDVKNEKLIEYAREMDKVKEKFTEVMFEQIPRKENEEKADTLDKMAGAMESWKTRDVIFQIELTPRVSLPAVEQEEEDWRTIVTVYLRDGKLPDNPREARKLKIKCSHFVLIEDVLYRRPFAGPLLRCLSYKEANYVLREVHEGCCGNHMGAYALTIKVLLAGYFWPSTLHDAQELVASCDSCQRHARLQHRPAVFMRAIVAACSFDQWRIDIVGPFPLSPAQKKFLLVAMDYFSKWVEAEPLAKITENEVLKFMCRSIVCRYRVPRKLISDNERQFQGAKIQAWCKEMKIQQVFTSVAYPQSNGQVEVTNRTLLQGLKVRLGSAKKNWVDELPSVLWAYWTTPREATKETLFSLVYGNDAVLPAEIRLESTRVMFYDEDNGVRRATDLSCWKKKEKLQAFTWKHIKIVWPNFKIAESFRRASKWAIWF